MRNLGACNHSLGWRASGVYTSATQIISLNKSNLFSSFSKLLSQRIAALTGTDNNRVVFKFGFAHVLV